jgi:hypothetical protein
MACPVDLASSYAKEPQWLHFQLCPRFRSYLSKHLQNQTRSAVILISSTQSSAISRRMPSYTTVFSRALAIYFKIPPDVTVIVILE